MQIPHITFIHFITEHVVARETSTNSGTDDEAFYINRVTSSHLQIVCSKCVHVVDVDTNNNLLDSGEGNKRTKEHTHKWTETVYSWTLEHNV